MRRAAYLAGAVALAITASFIGASEANAAGACQTFYTGSVPVPAGWAAAYDLFHAAHTLLGSVDCTLGTTPLSVGLPNDPTVYVYQTAYLMTPGSSSAMTNAPTVAGNAILHFASTPASVAPWQIVADTSTPAAIGTGVTVVSTTGTTVVLSSPVGTDMGRGQFTGPGVGNGDTITFMPGWAPVPLSAAQPAVGGWLAVPATAPLNLTSAQLNADWNYLAFLVARWNGSKWLIGCADAVCASSSWSLQAITRQTTLTVSVSPVAPRIADNTALGTTVGTISCVWSDASPCTATFGITDPAGIYTISGSNLIVNPGGAGVGAAGSSDTVTITATQ